jgi:hypothetical protein
MAIQYIKYHVKVKFKYPVLGAQSSRDVTQEFVAARAGVELPHDEEPLLETELDKVTTVFHHDASGNPILLNYQVKGFFKNAAHVLNGKAGKGDESDGVKNLRSKVVNNLFVSPRIIPLSFNGKTSFLSRPLMAKTMQGERVALTRSEQVENGSIEFDVEIVEGSDLNETVLRDLLDYGERVGIGRWRTADYGSFTYELKCVEKPARRKKS